VARTFERVAPEVVDVRAGGETITATPEHPFWVIGRGWTQARRENLRRGHRSLEGQLERLTEAYLKEVIPLEEYGRRRGLEQRGEGLAEGAKQVERQVERIVELAGLTASIEEFAARIRQRLDNAGFEQKRQLVELLIDRVVVSHEEVEIRYVVPTTKANEQVHFSHLRADYRTGSPIHQEEVAGDAMFSLLPHGGASYRRD
jgi:intein/homing endonuclease